MRYTVRQYTAALYGALKDGSEAEKRLRFRRFLMLLRKNRDLARLERILKEFEKQWLRESGLRKVEIESAAPASGKLKEEIKKILGEKILFSEKVNAGILAGVKILVDGELMIDASAKRQLDQILGSRL